MDLDPDPLTQFKEWYQQALDANVRMPHAMALATATADGRPSARMVLLKEVDERGFVFYTNYESRKGRELAENPYAALILYWAELDRQVRITGRVSRVSREESERYFRTRPAGSRLGAWASPQSQVIGSRQMLDDRLKELEEQYSSSDDIPLPPFWGGYRVAPETIEFWHSRPNRLHDRLLYTRQDDGSWRTERLAP